MNLLQVARLMNLTMNEAGRRMGPWSHFVKSG